MANLNGFDAREVEPATEFEPIPPGTYLAVAVASESKRTKAGRGSYIEFTFELLEGAFKGRKLWSRFNTDNPSTEAVRIARAQLSALCRATGVLTPRDSCELHGIPITIRVTQKVGPDGETRNEVRSFAKKETPNGATLPQTVSSAPPWRRAP